MENATNTNTPEVTVTPADLGMVELLDDAGNPTGQYVTRDGEAAPAEATIVQDAADHRVN